MSGIEMDFTGVEAAKPYEVVPPGKYLAVVREAEKTVAGTGTPGFKLEFEIVGGDYAGGSFRDRIYITQQAMPFVRQKLEALGVQIPAGPFRLTEQMLVGKRATLTVREEEYEGRDGPAKTLRVKAYEPPVAIGATEPAAGRHDDDIPF